MPALRTASLQRRTSALRKRHPEVGDRSPFEVLDLEHLDRRRPGQIVPLAGAATSAAASIAVTGTTVSTTVTGGAAAGTVVAAVAGDIASSMALLGRAIAEVAVHYGFDPSVPEEELFLLGVLGFSSAETMSAKTAALTNLSQLAQQMMRQASWKQLEKDVMVRAIQQVFLKLGLNLSKKRLAQVVPVAGGVLTASLSYNMLQTVQRDATRIYRARYLCDKYGLSFEDWAAQTEAWSDADNATTDLLGGKVGGSPAQAEDEVVIDLVGEIERAQTDLGGE